MIRCVKNTPYLPDNMLETKYICTFIFTREWLKILFFRFAAWIIKKKDTSLNPAFYFHCYVLFFVFLITLLPRLWISFSDPWVHTLKFICPSSYNASFRIRGKTNKWSWMKTIEMLNDIVQEKIIHRCTARL